MLEKIESLIKTNLPDCTVKVSDLTGTMDHLDIFVASDKFEGLSLIEQHQVLMDILKTDLSQSLHAVKLKTTTLKKYKESK